MHINFVPDLITCCCLLHKLLIHHREIDVEQILTMLDKVATTQEGITSIKDGEFFGGQ